MTDDKKASKPDVLDKDEDDPWQKGKELGDRHPDGLPEVPMPKSHLKIKWAIREALRHHSKARVIDAYKHSIDAAVGAVKSIDELEQALHERERTKRLLKDAEDIHRMDAAVRKKTRDIEELAALEAAQKLKDARLEAERRDAARTQERATMKGGSARPTTLSQEDEELQKEFTARMEQSPAHIKQHAEWLKEGIIEERGGKENLSAADHERLAEIDRIAQELIDETC